MNVELEDRKTKDDVIDLTPAAPVAEESKPTLKEAEEGGLSSEEIAMAKKSGLIDEAPPKPEKTEDEIAAEAAAASKKPDPKPKFEPKPWEKDIPDEETAALKGFSPNETALYWKQKREKFKRQQAEAERDHLKVQAAYHKGQAEAAAKALEDSKKAPAAPATPKDPMDPLAVLDEPEDDKNKPLTKADLEQIEKEKADKEAAQRERHEKRIQDVTTILDRQELEFKEEHSDFDQFMDRTKEILPVVHDDSKLAELIPDKVARRAAQKLAQDLVQAMTHPESIKPGQPTAAELAYELGQLYPEPSNAGDERTGKKGTESPTLEQRLDKQGRPSSASLSGGGAASKSIKDLTLKELNDMPTSKFAALKKKYPAEIERILRENEVD